MRHVWMWNVGIKTPTATHICDGDTGSIKIWQDMPKVLGAPGVLPPLRSVKTELWTLPKVFLRDENVIALLQCFTQGLIITTYL